MNHKCHLDKKNVPKELQLIIYILQNNETLEPQLLTNIDWKFFLELAVHHRVFSNLYSILNQLDKSTEIPFFVMDSLQEKYKRNVFRMLKYAAVIDEVSKLFANNNIPLLFLKGPTLGHDLYGDISLRTSGDIDVLIPINQLKEVAQLLLKEGYIKHDYIKTVLNDWKWRHHHIVFIHPVKKVALEVHWRLHPGPGKEVTFNELWEHRSKTTLTVAPVYTLDREYLFVYLITHGVRHGWSRFRWLLDIKQLMNQKLNWIKINHLLKRTHGKHIGGQAVILVSQWLNIPIPSEIKITKKAKKLASRSVFYLESMIHLHAEHVPIHVSHYHKQFLFSTMSLKQKTLFILSFLHPYPEDAETLRLPKKLHFLYFPLRPFLWMWRKTRDYALL